MRREARRLRSRPLRLLVLGGIIAASGVWAQPGPAPLPGLDGGQLTDAALESGSTIVVVWAGWSPRCRDIVERVNELQTSWSARARVLTVNFQEKPPAVRRFLSGQELSAPVFLDTSGAFSKRHAVTTLPGLVIYKNGRVAYKGKLPADADALIRRTLG